MVALLVGGAVLALGMPNFALARSFLAGNYATDQGATAVAGLVTWLVLGLAVVVVVTNSFRSVVSQAQFMRRRWSRAIFFAVVGTVVLGAGLFHHAATGYSMCCGSVQEAQQTLATK
jgi:membrane protease YdiL (CAAX protease family)